MGAKSNHNPNTDGGILGTLQDIFKVSCDALEDKRAEETLDQQNLARGLMAGNLEAGQVSGAFALCAKGAAEAKARLAERAKRDTADTLFFAMLDELRDITARAEELGKSLADKYGNEQFAVTFVEDLAADGLVSDEEIQRIRAIEDPKERQEAATELLLELLDNGTITYDDLKGHEWGNDPLVQEWLKAHEERLDKINEMAERCIQTKEISEETPEEVILKIQAILKVQDKDYYEHFGIKSTLTETTATYSLDEFT